MCICLYLWWLLKKGVKQNKPTNSFIYKTTYISFLREKNMKVESYEDLKKHAYEDKKIKTLCAMDW